MQNPIPPKPLAKLNVLTGWLTQAEARLEEPQTLDRLNQLFTVWLEECYQHKPHSGIEGELSPAVAYQSDRKTLKYLDPEILASAFMHCEERKVDKSGCISFEARKYEVGLTCRKKSGSC